MAIRNPRLLIDQDLVEQARLRLNPPKSKPDGDLHKTNIFTNRDFHTWLLEQVESRLGPANNTGIVLLGSAARGEICPSSDLDLILMPTGASQDLVRRGLEQGIKIRARTPEDPDDWRVGVLPFDQLALLDARLWKEGDKELSQRILDQKRLVLKKRRQLLVAIRRERKLRNAQFDSMANFLEPNIKSGPGGLRDLEQGLRVLELFPEYFQNHQHAKLVFTYYRDFWLTLRCWLNLNYSQNILFAHSQIELAKWMGFSDQKEFMREVQSGLSRVNFYSDWVVAVASTPLNQWKEFDAIRLKRPNDLINFLDKNQNILSWQKVRSSMDGVWTESKIQRQAKTRGRHLSLVLDVDADIGFLEGVFRSRLIDKLLPEIRPLTGWVQHDQYHRFTADMHLFQACREVKRLYSSPRRALTLSKVVRALDSFDWKILSWTALLHDLAKGRGEDHSHLGLEMSKRILREFGISQEVAEEVTWLVENHLILAHAAFRMNPQSESTLSMLIRRGAVGQRLRRLQAFTVIDILATNPEAFNTWKSQLIYNLAQALENPKNRSWLEFSRLAYKKGLSQELIDNFDRGLIQSVGPNVLIKDLLSIRSNTQSNIRFWKGGRGQIWLRWFEPQDRMGLLLDIAGKLNAAGLGIRQASVQTLPGIGVYDIFLLNRSDINKKKIDYLRSIENKNSSPASPFHEISIVSKSDREWSVLFRGKDQPGLFLRAVTLLSTQGYNIRSASIHTWGRNAEDIFHIAAPESEDTEVIEKLLQADRSL
ncbi:MAG: HD domain-containing protein [Bdellovibrionaceae bacterium]|nr:HD domain-containing protein [Pseudobdellovibrionaceae bacterium]